MQPSLQIEPTEAPQHTTSTAAIIEQELLKLQVPPQVANTAGAVLKDALGQCLYSMRETAETHFQQILPTLRANRDLKTLQLEKVKVDLLTDACLPDDKKFQHMLVHADSWRTVTSEIQAMITTLEEAEINCKDFFSITYAFAVEFQLQSCWKLAFPLQATLPNITAADQQLISVALRSQLEIGIDNYNAEVLVDAFKEGISKAKDSIEEQLDLLWAADALNDKDISMVTSKKEILAAHSIEDIQKEINVCKGVRNKVAAAQSILSAIQKVIPEDVYIQISTICADFQEMLDSPDTKKQRVQA